MHILCLQGSPPPHPRCQHLQGHKSPWDSLPTRSLYRLQASVYMSGRQAHPTACGMAPGTLPSGPPLEMAEVYLEGLVCAAQSVQQAGGRTKKPREYNPS